MPSPTEVVLCLIVNPPLDNIKFNRIVDIKIRFLFTASTND